MMFCVVVPYSNSLFFSSSQGVNRDILANFRSSPWRRGVGLKFEGRRKRSVLSVARTKLSPPLQHCLNAVSRRCEKRKSEVIAKCILLADCP